MLPGLRDIIPNLLASTIPLTYGNCASDVAGPQPCYGGSKDLYNTKGTLYKIRARWISGLNAFDIDKFDVQFDTLGTMTLSLVVRFHALPMSIQVEGCLGYCLSILDNTNMCCGSNKTLTIVASIPCCTSKPFLCNSSVVSVSVDPPVKASMSFGIGSYTSSVDVWDLTPTFLTVLKDQVESVVLEKILGLLNDALNGPLEDSIQCSA